jgi:hypothetical protein
VGEAIWRLEQPAARRDDGLSFRGGAPGRVFLVPEVEPSNDLFGSATVAAAAAVEVGDAEGFEGGRSGACAALRRVDASWPVGVLWPEPGFG